MLKKKNVWLALTRLKFVGDSILHYNYTSNTHYTQTQKKIIYFRWLQVESKKKKLYSHYPNSVMCMCSVYVDIVFTFLFVHCIWTSPAITMILTFWNIKITMERISAKILMRKIMYVYSLKFHLVKMIPM